MNPRKELLRSLWVNPWAVLEGLVEELEGLSGVDSSVLGYSLHDPA